MPNCPSVPCVRYTNPPPDIAIDWVTISSHPIRDCYPPPTAERYARLKVSLLENDQLRPVLIRQLPDGTYQLLDGGQRIKVQLERGDPIRFEIVVVEEDAVPSLILNANSDDWKGHTASQRALAARRIANRTRGGNQSANLPNGISISDAARAQRVSPRMVGMIGQVEATVPALIEHIAQGAITVSLAVRIIQIEDATVRAGTIDNVQSGNIKAAVAKIKASEQKHDDTAPANQPSLGHWRYAIDQLTRLTEDEGLSAHDATDIADALQKLVQDFEECAAEAADRERPR